MGLVLQAFVNMAVAVGLVPVTGQTLPLVSMGGSSIFFTSIATGMILSVSWGTKEVPGEAIETGKEEALPDEVEVKTPVREQSSKRIEFELDAK